MKIFKKGFTLIELLVVISIIGILIAVGVTSYQKSVKLSRDSKRKADIEQIRQALETYRSVNGAYPAAESSLVPDYIRELPTDPKDRVYTYTYLTDTTYTLCADLELDDPDLTCDWVVENP